jgi:hypothetical protein
VPSLDRTPPLRYGTTTPPLRYGVKVLSNFLSPFGRVSARNSVEFHAETRRSEAEALQCRSAAKALQACFYLLAVAQRRRSDAL